MSERIEWPLSELTAKHPEFETLVNLVREATTLSAKIESEIFGGPETADDYWFNVGENISVIVDAAINEKAECK